jgi:hypothetical protein
MARGNSLCFFFPQNNQPPSSNYATLDTRNGHLCAEHDDSAIESCIFSGILPRNYASGGITVTIAWMAATATTGDVVWGASFERHADDTDDLDSDGFAAEQTATATTASGTGEVQYTNIAFTDGAQIDSLAVSEHFRIKIRRVATDGADTMAGDAQLLSVEVRET